jgi:hypothetical protein
MTSDAESICSAKARPLKGEVPQAAHISEFVLGLATLEGLYAAK